MQEPIQDQIKSFSEEKFKALAEKNDWPLAYAQGYVEGEARRRSGEPAPRVALIGIDQHALGFRTGFFERRNPDSTRVAVLETRVGLPQLRLQA